MYNCIGDGVYGFSLIVKIQCIKLKNYIKVGCPVSLKKNLPRLGDPVQ